MDPKQEKRLALIVLLAVLLVNAVALWPELTVGRISRNDNASHFSLLEGMVQAVEQGQNPLDFWSPEIAFGFSTFRTYQPLADGLVALAYFALGKTVSLIALFVWVRYLAILLLPLSFFAMARLMGMTRLTAASAALLSPLIAGVGQGNLGVEYRSWLTFGVFPQLVATNLLLVTFGLAFQAVRQGRRVALAGACLGLTCMAHLIYGWMGALTICLLAVIPDAEAPRRDRIRRTILLGAVALALTIFELVPLFTDGYFMNHSRNEPIEKWDSYGAAQVLQWLFTGGLMDSSRVPVLTLLAFGGAGLWLWQRRQTRKFGPAQTWILVGALFWLVVFCGRATWGPLVVLIGVSADMHMHRVMAGVQIFMLLLAAAALAGIWREVGRRSVLGAALLTALLLFPLVEERGRYLTDYFAQGRTNIDALAAEQNDLFQAIALVQQRGGRAYPGLSTTWGAAFQVGNAPVFSFLTASQVPAVSHLYNATALPSDIMARFDETSATQYRLFNIRSVLGPAIPGTPPFLTPLKDFGRYRVLDAPGDGYFDLVDVTAAVPLDRYAFYDINDRWLHSDWMAQKQYLWLELKNPAPPQLTRIPATSPLPPAPAHGENPGSVKSERQTGQEYHAELDVARPSFALFKMTWHPNWVAYIDGKPQKTAMLSPGFLGVPVPAGRHQILCRYEPGNGRLYLAFAGFLLVGLAVTVEWRKTPKIPESEPPAAPTPPPVESADRKRKGNQPRFTKKK